VVEAAVVPDIEIAGGELRHNLIQPARHEMQVVTLGQVARLSKERFCLAEKEEH
jgi:hypothetical protein